MQQPHGNNNGGAPQNGSSQGQGNVPPGFTYQQAYGMPGQPGAGGSMPMTQMDPSAQAQHQQQFMRQHLQQQQLAAYHMQSHHLAQQHQQQLRVFWQQQMREIESGSDFKNHQLPLARIKKIMKSDEDVRMISSEAPVLFAKACEMFILELTLRSWIHSEENKRRTLQRNDIAAAITKTDIFDFLVDIVPRDDFKEEGMNVPRPGGGMGGAGDANAVAAGGAVPYAQGMYFMPPQQGQGNMVNPQQGMQAGQQWGVGNQHGSLGGLGGGGGLGDPNQQYRGAQQ